MQVKETGRGAMLKKSCGYTLVELIVVMAIFAVVIGITGDVFNKLLGQSSIQGRSAQGQIAGVTGIELLRRDLMYAGYGLPWSFQNAAIVYSEAAVTAMDSPVAAARASSYNDSGTADKVPRGVVSGNNTGVNGSDYLVIKSALVANSATAQRWTYINYTSPTKIGPHTWSTATDNLTSTDRVIVIKPTYDTAGNFDRQLIMNGTTSYSTIFNSADFLTNYRPGSANDTYYIYGIDPAAVQMPFNRADYFIEETNVPQRCAPHTGVLFKGIISQTSGSIPPQNKLPLLDCVADMQVVYDYNGGSTDDVNALPGVSSTTHVATAKDIRQNVLGIKVYILTHEGGRDNNYTYPSNTITVGEGLGQVFPLNTTIGATDWQHYRWKVYVLSVKPKNLNLQ